MLNLTGAVESAGCRARDAGSLRCVGCVDVTILLWCKRYKVVSCSTLAACWTGEIVATL